MRINHSIAKKMTQELNIEADVIQKVNGGVLIRALQLHQDTLTKIAKTDDATEENHYDLFDTFSLIEMIEKGEVLIAMKQSDIDNFVGGKAQVGYPEFYDGTSIKL
jgi:hypothetical protein